MHLLNYALIILWTLTMIPLGPLNVFAFIILLLIKWNVQVIKITYKVVTAITQNIPILDADFLHIESYR